MADDPGSVKNLPIGQFKQTAVAAASLYVPAAQLLHATDSLGVAALTRNVPTGQSVQDIDAEPANWPMGQALHASASTPVAELVK